MRFAVTGWSNPWWRAACLTALLVVLVSVAACALSESGGISAEYPHVVWARATRPDAPTPYFVSGRALTLTEYGDVRLEPGGRPDPGVWQWRTRKPASSGDVVGELTRAQPESITLWNHQGELLGQAYVPTDQEHTSIDGTKWRAFIRAGTQRR